MLRNFRNIYILALITISIFLGGWYYHYHGANKYLIENSRSSAEITALALNREIGGYLREQSGAIEAAAAFIALDQWSEEEILSYLTALLNHNENFTSIYFGTPDNTMINASGWTPPGGFDLRSRPWYEKAVAIKEPVFTEAFVNASADKVIVTVAAPVYGAEGTLLGVVGGDLCISTIITLVESEGAPAGSLSFLLDDGGTLLAHPEVSYNPEDGFVTLEEKYANLDHHIFAPENEEENGFFAATLDGNDGYLTLQAVGGTDWHLVTFIPSKVFTARTDRLTTDFMLALATSLFIAAIFLYYHYSHMHRPLLRLEKNVKKIDLEKSLTYRLPFEEHKEMALLSKTINSLLDRAENYFRRLEENEQKLTATNKELEDLVSRLTTAEEALDYSEERLYYLSYHDQLTGLYNRAYYEAKLNFLDRKKNYPISIIVTDIDGLKLLNDTLGHSTGDRILKRCADLLKESLNDKGILARISGDEFCAILPLTGKEEGEGVVRQIRFILSNYNRHNQDLPLSLSIGLATADSKDISLNRLHKMAEDNTNRDKLARGASARNSVVQSLLAALEERDYRSESRDHRVEDLCLAVGRKIKLDSGQLADLCLLSRVHDLGMVGIPDNILFKPGPLNEEEWAIMKKHPEKGYRIASTSTDLVGVADLILKHQEHWDGTGYPLGLKGAAIPLECRILAIVSAYDAMTSNRPYRPAGNSLAAVAELKLNAGTQFDPELVRVFIDVLTEAQLAKNPS